MLSAGVAERARDGEDVDGLCAAADRALYRAKAAGRARVLAAAWLDRARRGMARSCAARGKARSCAARHSSIVRECA